MILRSILQEVLQSFRLRSEQNAKMWRPRFHWSLQTIPNSLLSCVENCVKDWDNNRIMLIEKTLRSRGGATNDWEAVVVKKPVLINLEERRWRWWFKSLDTNKKKQLGRGIVIASFKISKNADFQVVCWESVVFKRFFRFDVKKRQWLWLSPLFPFKKNWREKNHTCWCPIRSSKLRW